MSVRSRMGIAVLATALLQGAAGSSAAQCIAPPADLVSWWTGDGSAQDLTGGHDGALRGTTTTGLVDRAFSLDGSDDFVSVPDDPALDIGAGDFTASLWVSFADTGSEQVIIEKYIEKFSPSSEGWTITKLSGNAVQFYTSGGIAQSAPLALTNDTWIHFAARRSAGSLSIFMDGVQIASGSSSSDVSSSASLKLGHRGSPADTPGSGDTRGFYLYGKIDEAQLFARALSDTEIADIFNAGSSGECKPAAVCGNGRTEVGESCDDGNALAGDGCENDCTLSCGNGTTTGSEACDDGNLVEGDGCDSNCTLSACGNGIVAPGEACDDGNSTEGDGCDSNCTPTACGNGIRSPGEACDDGNGTDGDGCETTCQFTSVDEVAPPGGTVTTDPSGSGATPQIPAQISLTTTNGGRVTINSTTGSAAINGVQLMGVAVQIEAPATTAAAPLVISFTVDPSVIPIGVSPDHLAMIRNGVPLLDCTNGSVADPDPCLASLAILPSGDLQLTALTSHASLWEVGVRGQNNSERKCVAVMNTAGVKINKVRSKVARACLKAASKGLEADAQACSSAASDAVSNAAANAAETELAKCTDTPPFGFTGTATIDPAAQAAALNTVADVFGANLSAAVIPADQPGAECQAAALKAWQKLFEAKAAAFVKCKRGVLAGKTTLAVTGEQMAGCFDTVGADSNGKIAKKVTKIDDALAEHCAGVTLATAMPGGCFGVANPAGCANRRTACRLCQMFNAMDALAADCDAFDDSLSNASCP